MALKCFIAMAFDRPDTDKLYDEAVRPLLTRLRVSPFRVDRSNRNDDVDDQILSELRRCDFAISDLTYARPSVYFEAGIAQGRGVPVIYTCRRDHFKPRIDDEHGNFRVHFDLQMKPIVKWGDPPSKSFADHLERRLQHIIRPLLVKQEASEKAEREIAKFESLSVNEKKKCLEGMLLSTIRRFHFRRVRNNAYRWAMRRSRGSLCFVKGMSVSTLNKNELYDLYTKWRFELNSSIAKVAEVRRLPKRVHAHAFLCVLPRVPRSRVASALPHFPVVETGDETVAQGTKKVSGLELKLEVPFHIHILSGIRSETTVRKTLTTALSRLA